MLTATGTLKLPLSLNADSRPLLLVGQPRRAHRSRGKTPLSLIMLLARADLHHLAERGLATLV